MDIYVYSDESGVFDKKNNDYFVFGGLIIIGDKAKEEWSRRYAAAEAAIRNKKKWPGTEELKAARLLNSEKGKMFRSLNGCYKFGVVVNQKELLDRIFESKKDKRRYLDYAFKIAIKRAFERMISQKVIFPGLVENIFFYVDEHTTATNGCYELREALEQELKNGTYNFGWNKFFPPIFPSLKGVNLQFCNSKSKLLVRAADIAANRLYYWACQEKPNQDNDSKFFIISLP